MALKRGCIVVEHERQNACYNCCSQCNYDTHNCPGCGTPLSHDGREFATNGRIEKFHFGCVDEFTERDGKVTTVRESE